MTTVSWTAFKDLINQKGLMPRYVYDTEDVYVFYVEGSWTVGAKINKRLQAEDLVDFETNFKAGTPKPIDSDGAQIVRMKAAKAGWTYSAIPIEFKTAEIGSLYSKNLDGTNRGGISLKFFDSNGNEITSEGLLEINESTIIRTVIDFEPDFDYEVIGGQLRIEQDIAAPQDCRLFIVAVPDIPAVAGGSKEMSGGINLRYLAPQNSFNVDGRVAKFLKYDAGLHTNKLRFIFQHTAGLKVWIHLTVELYRP